jgi:hypothetical protein
MQQKQEQFVVPLVEMTKVQPMQCLLIFRCRKLAAHPGLLRLLRWLIQVTNKELGLFEAK